MNAPSTWLTREQINGRSMLENPISFFDSVSVTKPTRNLKISTFLDEIKSGEWKNPIERLRNLKSDDYSKAKKALPAVTITGIFDKRNREGLRTPSGLGVIDLDGLKNVEAVRNQIAGDRYAAFVFLSPSGKGLKIGIAVEGDDYTAAYNMSADYFERQYRVKVDRSGSDVSRLCFVSYDPHLWRNEAYSLYSSNSSISPTSPPPPPLPYSSVSSMPSMCSIGHVIETIEADEKAEKRLDEIRSTKPAFTKLYEGFIHRIYEAKQGTRNKVIVDATPFLIQACSHAVAERLLLTFYDINAESFIDSRDQHQKEVKAAIQNALRSYEENLPDLERVIYEKLREPKRSAFRIIRDLAFGESNPEFPPPLFYLSCQTLSLRLSEKCDSKTAWRILRLFSKAKIIKQIEKGQTWAPGSKPKATVYRCMITEIAVDEVIRQKCKALGKDSQEIFTDKSATNRHSLCLRIPIPN